MIVFLLSVVNVVDTERTRKLNAFDETMVSNLYVNSMLKNLPHFRGCIACDQLETIQVNRGEKHQFVINTGLSTTPGEHFVYLEMRIGKPPLFVDSFGSPISNEFI